VQRAEHEVTGEGRLDGDATGIDIADLAHHDDVRVLPQQRPQGGGELEAGLVVHLKLVDAHQVVLDGVFHGGDVHFRVVDFTEHGVEGGALAAAGRTGDEHDAVGLMQRRAVVLQHLVAEAELLERDQVIAVVDDADHDLLAELARHGRDAQIDRAILQQHVDAAVLRQAALGDVQPGHDLDAADHGGVHLVRRADLLEQPTVHAIPHAELVVVRLDVDVG
jgi:hypothetical protein